MNKDLKEYKKRLLELSEEDSINRDLYLRQLSMGQVCGPQTGYPSIDKPWLRYYKEEYIKAKLKPMTAYGYIKEKNKNNMDLIAIDSEMGNFTYKELFNVIDMTANSLYELGSSKGDIILAMLPVAPHETFLLYGADKVGSAISYLPPFSTVKDICHSIDNFSTKLFFIFDFFLTEEMENEIYKTTNCEHIISIFKNPMKTYDKRTLSWEDFIQLGIGKELPNIERNPEDMLFIAKTGGSTGEPKNVMLNDNSFNYIVEQFINSDVNYSVGDRWLRLFPLFSATAAVNNHHLPLGIGMNNILRQTTPEGMKDFDKILLKEKPNHSILIQQLMDNLEKSPLLEGQDLSFVKTQGCGGTSITSEFEHRSNEFNRKHNIGTFLGYGWGCTEHGSNIAMRSNFETTIVGTVGAPMVKTIVSVFDPETGEELPYNVEGELCVYSPTIMMGYYQDQELTDKAIRMHEDGKKWLHTGDLGTISEAGIVKVNGRITRMIFTYTGHKVYPALVENLISKVPGVRDVAICSQTDEKHPSSFVPVCVIILEDNYNPESVKENIMLACEKMLHDYQMPKAIYIRDYMPLTKAGKTDVRALEYEIAENNKLTRKKAN